MSGNHRTVAVAEDADIRLFAIEPRGRIRGQAPLLIQDVTERDRHAGPAQDQSPRKSAGLKVIHIAGHRGDRSHLPQALYHVFAADIAGVQDFFHAGEMPFNGRIVESMRIGDYSDSKGPAFAYGAAVAAADL